jgi:protease IV
MRLNRLLNLILIVICLVAAIGNWFVGYSPEKSTSVNKSGNTDIALIDIYGTISDAPAPSPLGGSSGASSNTVIDALDKARKDNVKAILLRINSPGGTAAAAHAVYHELMRIRRETKIQIIASLGDVAASGGYYIASAAHHIVADPSSLTGSIGVIIRTQNVSNLLGKVGVETGAIKSGALKDLLSPFRDTTAKEQQLLQSIVQDSYQQFVEAIAAGRKLPITEIKPLADGRILTGAQAKALKLVDSLGNYRDALNTTASLAKIKGDPKVRNYTRGLSSSLLNRLLPNSRVTPTLEDISSFVANTAHNYPIPLTLME